MKASQARLIYIGFLFIVASSFMLQACGEAPEPEIYDKIMIEPIVVWLADDSK
ncbi:MAG: hypothetical protein WBN57_11135 [Gammaproteobacteria bacterium]